MTGGAKPRRRIDVPVWFGKSQLHNLRRFLNRALECAEGRCPKYQVHAWHSIKPLLEKVNYSLEEIKVLEAIR
jgi:hypothetical protein